MNAVQVVGCHKKQSLNAKGHRRCDSVSVGVRMQFGYLLSQICRAWAHKTCISTNQVFSFNQV